ncbi:MAG: hypothetical protein WCY77_09870 [Weeksellaceae bacterium]
MNISVKDNIAAERAIGQKYAKLLRNSVRSQLSVLNKKTGKTSRPGYRVRLRSYQLQSISVVTQKSAFVNHFGADTVRKAHTFKSKKERVFQRKEHPFKLNPKIKTLEIPASIINGLADEIADLRGREVLVEATKALDINENK